MTNIEKYKSRLTKPAAEVFEHFEMTGEDDISFLGKIASGIVKGVTLADVVHRAQVFGNASFRGRVGSPKSFYSANFSVVTGALDGSIKGIINNGFTSCIVADSKVGLSDLRESYAKDDLPFYLMVVSADFSDIENKLSNIASDIMVPVKKYAFLKAKSQPMTITKTRSKNSLCDLMEEIYQVVDKSNKTSFDTDLEKATSNIFATWLISRALNLSIGDKDNQCEQKLDEAMRLQFYTHLNGCNNKGNCAISKIIKVGTDLGVELIEKMGLNESDVKDKLKRLGTPLQNNPETIYEALFGEKEISKTVDIMVDSSEAREEGFPVGGIDGVIVDYVPEKAYVEKNALSAVAQATRLITDGTRTEVVKPTQEVAEKSQIAKSGETIAKVGEKVVDQNAVVGNPGDVAHKKGNAVNYSTLKKNLLKYITDKLDDKAAYFANRAEKQKDFDALTESNFWAGASAGVSGFSKPKGKTAAYYAGHMQGQNMGRGLVQEIDKIYSPDKKILLVDVNGKGAQVTKNLGDLVVKAFRVGTFAEFVEKVVSSLSMTFEKFKNNTTNTSNQQTP